MLVDDNEIVRRLMRTVLERAGIRVTDTDDPHAALGLLRSQPWIRLAVLDYAMPEMTGSELLIRLRTIAPALPVLIVTGAACNLSIEGQSAVLLKPFTCSALVAAVSALLTAGRN